MRLWAFQASHSDHVVDLSGNEVNGRKGIEMICMAGWGMDGVGGIYTSTNR